MRQRILAVLATIALGLFASPVLAVTTVSVDLLQASPNAYVSDSGSKAAARLHDVGDGSHLFPQDVRMVDSSGNYPASFGISGTIPLPYNASYQLSPSTNSFGGVSGYDGTYVNAWAVNTHGVGNIQVCDPTGLSCPYISIPGDGYGQASGLYTVSQNEFYNGANLTRQWGDTTGVSWTTTGGRYNAGIAAATSGPTVIKASAGRLAKVLITTAGTTGTETFYDNASACSGRVIGVAAGTTANAAAVAGYTYELSMPAANGITACGGTGSAAVTVSYW